MQLLGAVAHSELGAELPEAAPRQPLARRQADVLGVEPPAQLPDALAVLRVALVVAAGAVEDARVGGAVDVVDRAPDRRQPARHERFPQPLGREREVGRDAEAAVALAEHAPALDAELAAYPLGVADDRFRAEVREVIRLLLGAQPRQRPDRRRAARPALVEHQDAELLQRAVEPSGRRRMTRRPRRLAARPALE